MDSNKPDEAGVWLDPETLRALDEGIRLAESGRRWTMEEAFAYVRERRQSIVKEEPPLR